MKRIAIIVPGGIGNGKFLQGVPSMVNLIERLSHDFEIIVYSLVKTEAKEVSKYYKLKSIPVNLKSPGLTKALLFLSRFLIDHMVNRFDLIHAFWALPAGHIAVKLSKLLKIHCLVTLQGGETANLPEINYGNILKERSKKKTLDVCKKADKIVTLTNFQLSQLRSLDVLREDIDIIPYGAEEKLFTFNKTKNFAEPYKFIHVANLTEVKDQVTLLRVFKIISEKIECQLTIIGDDFLQGKIQKFVKDIGLKNVLFVDAVRHHQLNKYMSESHVMLHTSVHEAQAVVINEAMSSGVIVCGCRVGLLYDLTDDFCVTTDCGDYITLAEKILELISDKERIEVMKISAFDWSVNHSASWTYELYKKNYEKLISN